MRRGGPPTRHELKAAEARDCVFMIADDRLAKALGAGPLAGHVRALSALE